MKILIIGGVAAGTKVAAKLKRECPSAEILILNKGKDISYAGCGLPYYVGDVIHNKEELIVNTPEKFMKLTGAVVKCNVEATKLDRSNKKVTAIDMTTKEETIYEYDKLVIATGAVPIVPPLEGIHLKNIFYIRTPEDAIFLRHTLETQEIKKAVVVGGGYIGLEVAENLAAKGIRTTVLDMADHILPGFDTELAEYVENHLAEHGIMTFTNEKVTALIGEEKIQRVQCENRKIKTDLVVMSVGIRPNTQWLKDSGLDMIKGTLLTNKYGLTNDPDIYSAGDCAMVYNAITQKPVWSPMGSTANIAGRNIAKNIAGGSNAYEGVLGTAVCRLPELNVGRTGLTEAQAKEAGYNVASLTCVIGDKAHYYPGASDFIVKMIADKTSLQFLGIQVLGKGAVDKMVDIAVTAIYLKASLSALLDMDFAYAPPFSTAIHPFATAINIFMNKLNGKFESITPLEFKEGKADGYKIVDVCLVPTIPEAPYIDLPSLTAPIENLGLQDKILLVCNKGKRAYLTQNRLKSYGYTNVLVLEGGTIVNGVDLNTGGN